MKLTGIIENVFNGRLIFRGYATLVDLVEFSQSNDNYQRKADSTRIKQIATFMNGDNLYEFFTELLFGLEFVDTNAVLHINQKHINGTVKLSDNIKLSEVRLKNANIQLNSYESDNTIQKIISLEFDNNATKLSRIDGNHRLTAVEDILKLEDTEENNKFKEKIKSTVVPFSILMHTKSDDSENYEAAIFYLINSNAVPLTCEQNLKALFTTNRFSQTELSLIFNFKNTALLLDVLNTIKKETYSSLKNIFDTSFFTCVYKIISLIENGKDKPDINRIAASFQQVANDWSNMEEFKDCLNVNIVAVLIYYHSISVERYNQIIPWLKRNRIYQIEDINVDSIVNLYEKAMNSKVKVFVAMPYFSSEIVRSTNDIYSRVLTKIHKQYGIDISMNGEIMTYEGSTVNIVNDVFERIENCDICFCDITDNNPNVTYEMGWARALKKHVVILKEESAEGPKSDYKLDNYSTYKKDAHLTLEEAVEKNIIAILKKNYSITV